MEDKETRIAQFTMAQFIILVFVSGGLIGLDAYAPLIVLWVVVGLYIMELAKVGIEND